MCDSLTELQMAVKTCVAFATKNKKHKKGLEDKSKFEEDLNKLLDIAHPNLEKILLGDRTRGNLEGRKKPATTKVPAKRGRLAKKKVESVMEAKPEPEPEIEIIFEDDF